VAKFDKVIPPGQEGKIELVVEGAKVHGEFNKAATVKTNDPAHPMLTIAIAGKEIPFVNVMPEGTVYLHGRYGEAVEKAVAISSNEKNFDFKVTGVTSNIDDKITYELENGARAGEYNLKIFKNPKLATMSTYGSITIHTNSTVSPQTTLQVHVMTKGSITVSPTTVNFGPIKFATANSAATPSTKAVTLAKTTGQFQIKDVTVSNPNFTAVVEPVTAGQQYRVQVTFTPPIKKMVQHAETGELIIHTDDPMEPALRVQLRARAM
jgi:hypothetical protein